MAETQYLIVGGGLAAASAVEGIRELDASGPITIVTAERELPYHRPPLSKAFLGSNDGVDSVRVHDAGWYRDAKVRVRLGQPARSVHIGRQSVTLENGERLPYDRLLIATGSSARRLLVPGGDAHGIHTLRTLTEAYALRALLKPGLRLVIVGGGFLGMEVAAVAARRGVRVTVLEQGPVVYRAFADAQLSAFFTRLVAGLGATVRTGVKVTRFTAEDGRVTGVQSESGEKVEADAVLVAIGSEPNTAWLATAGFSIDRGSLIVNVRLETPGKHIWAAGDVTRFPDPVTRQPRKLEHWGNAIAQGRLAGRNMAGANEPFTHQASFHIDLLDLSVMVLGDTEQADSVTVQGTIDGDAPQFTALHQRGGKLTGAVMVNPNAVDRSAEFLALEAAIAAGKMPE
jgi:3-phenylpropionate/trans-cinnamate dioxygenase ferredoxin reductase subunit